MKLADWMVLLCMPLLWAQAVYGTPFLRTKRHGLSLALAVLAGLLFFVAGQVPEQAFHPVFFAGCFAAVAMFAALIF